MAVFYHYTGVSNLRSIFEGGQGWGEAGLRPRRRFLTLHFSDATNLPDQAHNNALFGLLEPFPCSWIETDPLIGSSHLEDVAQYNFCNSGTVCLECQADDSKIFVTDLATFFTEERASLKDKTDDERNSFFIQARIEYWQKLIPYRQYQDQKPSYRLPEIISFDPIPPSHIKIKKRYENRSAFLEDLAAHRPQL